MLKGKYEFRTWISVVFGNRLSMVVVALVVYVLAVLCCPMKVHAEENIGGNHDVSELIDNAIYVLNADTTLTINADKTIEGIKTEGYDLTINGQGNNVLTITDKINDTGIGSYSKLNINGARLYSSIIRIGNGIVIDGGEITVSKSINATYDSQSFIIKNGAKVTANGTTGYAITSVCNIVIENSTVNATSGDIMGYPCDALYSNGGSITISGEDTVVNVTSAQAAAVKARNGIEISAPLGITTPAGGTIGQDSGYYYVYNGNVKASTVVIRKPIPGGAGVPAGNATSSNDVETPSHEHNYEWQESRVATEDADGEMIYVCTICGDVKYREATSAYNTFNAALMEKIRKAAPGATVVVDTNKWISFHHMIIDILAERPDVTLKINFLSEGHKGTPLTVTIPAGADYKSLVDKNGFTGFLFMGSKYGVALR